MSEEQENQVPPQWAWVSDCVSDFLNLNNAIANFRVQRSISTKRDLYSNLVAFYMKMRMKIKEKDKKSKADTRSDQGKYTDLIKKLDGYVLDGKSLTDDNLIIAAMKLGDFLGETGMLNVEINQKPLHMSEAVRAKFKN